MWTSIIQDLLNQGLTQRSIADEINASQAFVSFLLTKKVIDPGWSKGEALLRLHAKHCCLQNKQPAEHAA